MIEIYYGKPGMGKSLKLADKIVEILARNERWFKRTGQVRKIASNLRLSSVFEEQYGSFVQYWDDPIDLINLRDVDIFWDEIATHLDSTQWQNVPLDLKRFLQQHRKRGIDIYGTTQAFGMVDISMRRLVDNLFLCRKITGSRNPSATKPPVKTIWGLIWLWEIEAMSFEDEKPKHVGYDWVIISRRLVEVYDTTQEIMMGVYPPLRHVERHCLKPGCFMQHSPKIIHM